MMLANHTIKFRTDSIKCFSILECGLNAENEKIISSVAFSICRFLARIRVVNIGWVALTLTTYLLFAALELSKTLLQSTTALLLNVLFLAVYSIPSSSQIH